MEIKIGIKDAPRELVVETNMTPEEIEAQLDQTEPNESSSMLKIEDTKGGKVLVYLHSLAYLIFGDENPRTVGFGTV